MMMMMMMMYYSYSVRINNPYATLVQ